MENDSRSRQDVSEADSGPVPGTVDSDPGYVAGWCLECSCEAQYHLGDDAGRCLYCGCECFVFDPDSDVYDRIKHYLLPELPPTPDELVQEDIEPTDSPVLVSVGYVAVNDTLLPVPLFFGRVSRSCKECGLIKLYKEFRDSREPEDICTMCVTELLDQEVMEGFLSDDVMAELNEVEEDIFENEMAYEEALEKQEWIDQCLRELDE
jgi:hypothetical protein